MPVKRYDELIAWQKAMDLVEVIYRASAGSPKEEVYGLSSQLRRAAVSVPSNLAEGQGHKSTAEFLHHLSIALGSLKETETHLIIAGRLSYLTGKQLEALLAGCAEVGRLLNGLNRALERKLSVA